MPNEVAALRSAPTLDLCRSCFWSADTTRPTDKIWCAHKVWHGWHTDKPLCDGEGYEQEVRVEGMCGNL